MQPGTAADALLRGGNRERHRPTRPTFSRLLAATFLACSALAGSATAALSRSAVRAAYLVAGVQTAFVPSLYFGSEPADFL